MRTAAISLALLSCSLSALAARPVTVQQIDQLLDQSKGKSDASLAGDLAGLEPTQRVSAATLRRWEAKLPGNRSRTALLELADTSAFLPLPSDEVLPMAVPDGAASAQLISRTIEYLRKAVPNLPNFLATRETTRFEDSPPDTRVDGTQVTDSESNVHSFINDDFASGKPWFVPFFFVAKYQTQVTYRDGREVQLNSPASDPKGLPSEGFITRGEFGTLLAVVIDDAFHGKLYWDHWEQGPATPLAVFRYTVAQPASHYKVDYPSEDGLQHLTPAYHGELAIDPATGTVLRLTVVTDARPPYQLAQVAVVVEYGKVQLGGKLYICPLHAVALSREPVFGEGNLTSPPRRTFLNDVAFTHYHIFRAEAHILSSSQPVQP